jgi:proteasome assembly chaperone (PAC2) family protein
MQPLIWDRRPDGLRAPALVCAFTGWNDAGDAASAALNLLGTSLGATRFARLDPEEFFDFQAQRPTVEISESRTREIVWPEIEIYEARIPRAHRDLVLLQGPEPSYRWRSFCEAIVELAEALGIQMVVTLGALLADVPHTRPVQVTGTAADDELVSRLGLQRSRYEGPTGIVGVLHDALSRAGVPSASLWAAVPHYVAATPSPKAALALVQRTADLLSSPMVVTDLEIAAASYERQVSEVVEADDDVSAYVRQLEERSPDEDDDELDDEDYATGEADFSEVDLPSGDALAAELERFLRDHDQRPPED